MGEVGRKSFLNHGSKYFSNVDFDQRTLTDLCDRIKYEVLNLEEFELRKAAKNYDCVLLFYDISREITFQSLKSFVETKIALLRKSNPNVLIFLLGNKADLPKDQQKITFEQGKKLAEIHDFYFFNISLLENNAASLFPTFIGIMKKG